jgi:hypothetical protein
MDDYDLAMAKLRMQCLELAKDAAVVTCSGTYSIVSDAEKYWKFVRGPTADSVPPAKSGDDILF